MEVLPVKNVCSKSATLHNFPPFLDKHGLILTVAVKKKVTFLICFQIICLEFNVNM